MQRICEVRGGVNAYEKAPDCLLEDEENLLCILCEVPHRLRRHGCYCRQALFPAELRKISIVRLLCVRTGQTISLLPDFCIPRRQHGPDILALFIQALLQGKALLQALREARCDAPFHATAQSLRDGFLGKETELRAYIARLHPRAIRVPATVPKKQRLIAELFFGLSQGFPCPQSAFTFHGRVLHREFKVALT